MSWEDESRFTLIWFTGKYLYIEADAARKKGDNALYVSTALPPTNGSCLFFYYHMYGNSVGDLRVLFRRPGNPPPALKPWAEW